MAGRWLKRLLILIVLLLIAALALPGLLADSVIRGKVEEAVAESLGAHVVVDGLSVGWWSDIEVGRLAVHEGGASSPVLLASEFVHVDSGLWGLLFGGDTVRVVIKDPVIRLRKDERGALNVMSFVDRMPPPAPEEDGDDEPATFPARGAELDIQGGKIVMGDGGDAVTYALAGGVSCENLDGDPVRFRLELARAAGGKIVVGGEVESWNGDEAPAITGSVEGSEVDLSTFTTILEATAQVRAVGVVERLMIAAEPRGDGRRIAVETKMSGVSVAGVGESFGTPLETIDVRLGANQSPGRIDGLAGLITLPQGSVELDKESHAAWTEDSVRGRIKIDGAIDDLASLQTAIAGMIPDGVVMSGRATASGWAEGVWSLGDAAWTEQVQDVRADLRVTADAIDYQATELRGLNVGGKLESGILTLDGSRVDVGGGSVEIAGALPIADATSDARLNWTIAPRVTFAAAVEGSGQVAAVLSGGGAVAMKSGAMRLTGDVALDSISAPDLPGVPLHVKNGKLTFDVTTNPDTGRTDIGFVHVKDAELDVKIEQGVIEPVGDTQRAVGQVTARLGAAFLQRLTSEVRIDSPVTVSGRVETRFDDPMVSSEGTLSVVTGGLGYDFHRVMRSAVELRKSGESIAIQAFDCNVDGGRIRGSGRVHVDGLRAGDLVKLTIEKVALAQPLAEGAYRLDGILSGTVDVHGRRDATEVVLDVGMDRVRLSGAEVEATELARLDLDGTVARGTDGELSVSSLKLVGDGMSVDVASVRMPAADGAPLTAKARVDATAPWIGAMLAPWMPEGIELEDRVRLDVDGSLVADRFVESASGRLDLQLPALQVNRRPLRDVRLSVDVKDGRAAVREGAARSGEGSASIKGAMGLMTETRKAGDGITVTLNRFPFTVDQGLEPTPAGSARRISTTGTLNGTASVAVANGTDVALSANMTARAMGRHLVVGSAAPVTVSMPNMKLGLTGTWLDQGDGVLAIDSVKVTGNGTSATIEGLRHDAQGLSIENVHVLLPPNLLKALMMTGEPPAFEATDRATAGIKGFRLPYGEDGAADMSGVEGVGTVRLKSGKVSTLDMRDLQFSYTLADGVCLVRKGTVVLSEGNVTFEPGTRFGLGPDTYPFAVKGVIDGIQLNEGWRTPLGVMNPLLLGTPRTDDASLVGRFDGDVDIKGTWSSAAGWSKTVNGGGRIRLSNVNVKSSAVLLGLASRADSVLGGSAASAIFDVLGERGAIGKILRPLTTDGYGIQNFDTGLDVRQGRVHLRNGVRIPSKELTLTVNGWGSLEGDVNYRVDTDIVARLKKRAEAKLAERGGGGVLGGILGVVNPLSKIVDIELGVTVKGNATAGLPAIDVGLLKPRGK